MYNGGQGPFFPPNLKLVYVADANGLQKLAGMQPTHRTLYYTRDLATTGTTVRFFNTPNPNTGVPFTNMVQTTLTDGNAMILTHVSFYLLLRTAGGQFTQLSTIAESTLPQLQAGEFSLLITNQRVIDSVSLVSMAPPFNEGADFEYPSTSLTAGTVTTGAYTRFRGQCVKTLASNPVILPNQQFQVELNLPAFTAPAADTVYIGCMLEGFGTLPAPTSTL